MSLAFAVSRHELAPIFGFSSIFEDAGGDPGLVRIHNAGSQDNLPITTVLALVQATWEAGGGGGGGGGGRAAKKCISLVATKVWETVFGDAFAH